MSASAKILSESRECFIEVYIDNRITITFCSLPTARQKRQFVFGNVFHVRLIYQTWAEALKCPLKVPHAIGLLAFPVNIMPRIKSK